MGVVGRYRNLESIVQIINSITLDRKSASQAEEGSVVRSSGFGKKFVAAVSSPQFGSVGRPGAR